MFFPSPDERPLPAFVRAEFPFPLALTCARLEAQMDRDEPVAAARALRDAFECAVKFTAGVAVADFLQARPPQDEAAALAALLLKPKGLSIGDWHTLLGMALAPLAPLARDGRLDAAVPMTLLYPPGKIASLALRGAADRISTGRGGDRPGPRAGRQAAPPIRRTRLREVLR